MAKKQEKPICDIIFRIGKMERTIKAYRFRWGVHISVRDTTDNGLTFFNGRNFNKTAKYPTIESNIKRGLSYFKTNNEDISRVLTDYQILD